MTSCRQYRRTRRLAPREWGGAVWATAFGQLRSSSSKTMSMRALLTEASGSLPLIVNNGKKSIWWRRRPKLAWRCETSRRIRHTQDMLSTASRLVRAQAQGHEGRGSAHRGRTWLNQVPMGQNISTATLINKKATSVYKKQHP